MRRAPGSLLLAALLATGCARPFPGPISPQPGAQQAPRATVLDDGTVSHSLERLEVSLRPMTAAELDRAFPAHSSQGAQSTNPYTYGNWTPPGDTYTPPRFTVFLLRVKNYQYPKVRVDPQRIVIRCQNRRIYEPLNILRIGEYYRAHALAWAGNAYQRYRESEELLRRTLYASDMVFSGQEREGYVVFEPLAPDVTRFSVTLDDVALRFNYADEPLETVQLTYRFEREVPVGYEPPGGLR